MKKNDQQIALVLQPKTVPQPIQDHRDLIAPFVRARRSAATRPCDPVWGVATQAISNKEKRL